MVCRGYVTLHKGCSRNECLGNLGSSGDLYPIDCVVDLCNSNGDGEEVTIQLWTTQSIANELEVSRSLVQKWYEAGKIPAPFAIAGKTPGWSDDQVKEIIKGYHERNEPRRIVKVQEEREERMIEILREKLGASHPDHPDHVHEDCCK